MYNDTIKAENKIIDSQELAKIFQMMGDTLKKYQRLSADEDRRNSMLDYLYQSYTFKDEGSNFRAVVDFYDNTNIKFDKYDSFMGIFYSRLSEIKSMQITFSLNYSVITPEPNRSRNAYYNHISMYITDKRLDIDLDLNSDDNKLEDIYNCIKEVVLTAPEKYDDVIKKRNKIANVISLGYGLIPALVVTTLLLFIPGLNTIFFKGYVVYPIIAVFLAFIIGSLLTSSKMDKYYEPILPEQKSAGYDSNYNRIYKDDIETFTNTSDILIGKKVDYLANRQKIQEEYGKYKKLLPKELIALGIMMVVVIIIGFFI